MPRTRTRAVQGPQAASSSIPQEERETLVRDVVQAVLAVISSAPTSSTPTSSGVQSTPSTGTSLCVPSFASTFTFPSSTALPPCTVMSSTAPMLSTSPSVAPNSSYANATATNISVPSIAPILHQPFVVGPGCSPVPAKIVAQIVSGKFIDLSELISANMTEVENEPQLLLDGRVVLSSTPKRSRRKIEDIVTWVEAFNIYMLVLTFHFPQRWNDLLHYLMLIMRTYRQFNGTAWLSYDKAFRENAAATKLADWSGINTQLYSYCTAGSFPKTLSGQGDLRPQGTPSSSTICRSWNRGKCSSRFASCRYAHKCSSCSGDHRLVDCPKVFATRDDTGPSKRRAPSPVEDRNKRRSR